MKKLPLLLSCLSVIAFATGCDKEPTATQQLDQVKVETKDAAQDMAKYTFAQKDEFVREMQAELDKLNLDLEALSAKIDKSSDAVKTEAKPKLDALRGQVADLNKQLADAKNATEKPCSARFNSRFRPMTPRPTMPI